MISNVESVRVCASSVEHAFSILHDEKSLSTNGGGEERRSRPGDDVIKTAPPGDRTA